MRARFFLTVVKQAKEILLPLCLNLLWYNSIHWIPTWSCYRVNTKMSARFWSQIRFNPVSSMSARQACSSHHIILIVFVKLNQNDYKYWDGNSIYLTSSFFPFGLSGRVSMMQMSPHRQNHSSIILLLLAEVPRADPDYCDRHFSRRFISSSALFVCLLFAADWWMSKSQRWSSFGFGAIFDASPSNFTEERTDIKFDWNIAFALHWPRLGSV